MDKKGFDLLGKVPSEEEARDEYQWRELRFEFVGMEQEVVNKFTNHTGL